MHGDTFVLARDSGIVLVYMQLITRDATESKIALYEILRPQTCAFEKCKKEQRQRLRASTRFAGKDTESRLKVAHVDNNKH